MLKRRVSGPALAAVLAAGLGLAGPARAAGNAIELRGVGAQIYVCQASASGFEWRFKAPEARLVDGSGAEFGRHFAGPSWQAKDGSTVVGEVVATGAAPRPDSIPWLLLRAKSHDGAGVLANIGFIVRSQTQGGAAPREGCDAAHAGAENRASYEALYTFFPQP